MGSFSNKQCEKIPHDLLVFQRQSSRINPEHRILLGFSFLEGFSKSQDGQLPTQQSVQQILPSLIPCKIIFSHCISIFLNLSLIVVLISAIARALRVRTKTVLVLPKAIKDFLIRQLKPLLVTYYSLQKAIQYQNDLKIAKRSNLEFKKNQASSARNRKNRNNLNSKTKNPASQNQNTLNFGENTCKQLNIVSCFQA